MEVDKSVEEVREQLPPMTPEQVKVEVDKYLDEYLVESKALFTKDEVYSTVQHLLPITYEGLIVGVLGLDIFPSQYLEQTVPVLKLIYITPEARTPGSFKRVIRDIMTELNRQGFTKVEIHMNQKINNWFKRELHSRPHQYAHLQDIEFYLKQLTEE
jgi:hypothetical protein